MGRLDSQQPSLGMADIYLRGPTKLLGTENDGPAFEILGCHLVDQRNVVSARNISDVYRPARETSGSCMEAGVGVIRLEHVPVGQHVEMLG